MILVLIFLLAQQAKASTIEPWLGGTRPYENVPFEEVNAILQAQSGPDAQAGCLLDWGAAGHWSLQAGAADSVLGNGILRTELGSQLRLGEDGDYPLDLSAAIHWQDAWGNVSGPNEIRYTLILAKVLAENDFDANLSYDSLNGAEAKLAYRSPYLYWTLQGGLEVLLSNQEAEEAILPQVLFLFPGDIALSLGASFWPDQATKGLLQLSYEIFPNP